MGGARIDMTNVRKVVSSQSHPFEYTDIARECDISAGSANRIINDMLAEGSIVVDHKIGKRKLFAVSGNGSKDGIVKPNISMLPPSKRFEYVADLVDMVAQGISPSVLITGVSGIGKSYIVKNRLEANGLREDTDFIVVKGHASPLGLYRLLFEHQRQRIVFDDCDSIFKESDSINLLKAALDSYDRRIVAWHSSKLPEDLEPQFEFEGQVIFVSNLTADRIDEPVKSRTITIDLQLSRAEICDYIGTILHHIDTPLSLNEKQMVLSEVSGMASGFEQFNIRTFIKACRIYKGATALNKDWKEMLSVTL